MSEQKPNQNPTFSSFADWCFNKDNLSEEARHTVEILLEYAETSDCYEAAQKLSSLTKLTIRHKQISDLSPLSTLTNLTWLSLCKNQIGDIRPLSTLTNLTNLYLNDNKIAKLSPLSTLTNLASLDLSRNQIADILPLSTLTNLTKLCLTDNKIAEIRPLLTLTNLTYLKLYNNQIAEIRPLPRSLLEKWHNLYTKPIDPQKANAAIKSAYALIGKPEPEIIFCSSLDTCLSSLSLYQCRRLEDLLQGKLYELITKLPIPALWDALYEYIEVQPGQEIKQQLNSELTRYGIDFYYFIFPEDLLKIISVVEYCVSKLGCVLDPETQEAFHCINQLFEHCGWIFPYEEVCIVCDRPTQLFFDNEYRLHAEGQPAIQFSDGYSLYSYHGVTLPEKYGKIHPNNWQAEWILSEENAELRRVLIQGIGYARICQELAAQELDTWREYTLLKIDNDVDVEPVYLLKMTCPSTGHIHALRVPPDIQTAREAIRWVNWDIDPEEFSVET